MTLRKDVLAALKEPMTVNMLVDQLGGKRSRIFDAMSDLRLSGCIRLHHLAPRLQSPEKFWIATGKPYAPAPKKRAPTASVRKPRSGSGVIAPSPYAYGYLWGTR